MKKLWQISAFCLLLVMLVCVIASCGPKGPTYTVQFVDEDGTVLKTEVVEEGKAATPPADPTRENYTFAGWDGKYDNVRKDTTVTATYTENGKFMVTFVDWNGGLLKREQVYAGQAATAPADPTREHYTFIGWDKEFNQVTERMTVTAQYEEDEKFEVIFVNWDGTELKTEEVYSGEAATPPRSNPTREDHTFTGWDVDYNNITEDTTVTAVFEENAKFDVTFVDHDGNTLATETVYIGKNATAPVDPIREGYRFAGWEGIFTNVQEAKTITATYVKVWIVTFVDHEGATIGTAQIIDDGKDATAPADPTRDGYRFTGWEGVYTAVASDVTVTAQYIEVFTVTFVDHDDSILKTETVDKGNDATAPEDPAREGYKFIGWDTTFTNVQAAITVTAKYKAAYTVTFVDWDGRELKVEQVVQGEDATAPAEPTRVHYTFTGWDKTFTAVSENMTVIAEYTENEKFTVTFADHDGSTIATQEVYAGEAATAPANPTRFGYTFTGWDKSLENITEATTITAQYKENPKFTILQWSVGKAATAGKTTSIVAALNPDFVIINGSNTNDFKPTYEGYSTVGYGSGNTLKNSCYGHHVFYKADVYTPVGNPVAISDGTISYVFFSFTMEDGSTLTVVSAYFKNPTQAQFATFNSNITSKLASSDYAIAAIHVATATESDTAATYQDKFTFAEVDANGKQFVCGTGTNALNSAGAQVDTGMQHFNYVAVYGSVASGTITLVEATDDTTTFAPTGKDWSGPQNAFYCKAFTTEISITPAPVEETPAEPTPEA